MENRDRGFEVHRNDRGASRPYDREYEDRYAGYGDEQYDRDYWGANRQSRREVNYFRGPSRSHLRCRDIMTRNLITCSRETPIYEVARFMKEGDVGAVPVLGADGRLEGIVTDRDLVVKGLTSSKEDSELRAEDCMSDDIYTANQNDRVVDVIREMGDHQVRRVPVVNSRARLVGIISVADLATETNRDQELEDALEEISKPSSWLGRVARWIGL